MSRKEPSVGQCIRLYHQAKRMVDDPAVTVKDMLFWLHNIDPRFSITHKKQGIIVLYHYCLRYGGSNFIPCLKFDNGLADVLSLPEYNQFNLAIYLLAKKEKMEPVIKYQESLLKWEIKTLTIQELEWLGPILHLLPTSGNRMMVHKLYDLLISHSDDYQDGLLKRTLFDFIKTQPIIEPSYEKWKGEVMKELVKFVAQRKTLSYELKMELRKMDKGLGLLYQYLEHQDSSYFVKFRELYPNYTLPRKLILIRFKFYVVKQIKEKYSFLYLHRILRFIPCILYLTDKLGPEKAEIIFNHPIPLTDIKP